MSSKSVTDLLEKNKKLKIVLKKHYDPSGKKKKIEKCPQKALRPFWKKNKKLTNVFKSSSRGKKNLKNVIKKRYGSSGEKSKKLKNVLKLGLGIIQTRRDVE